jgi:indolepyruvate ferredoxin oxidoreductase
MIKARDEEDGLNTGGFISGYRGSPLGSYDQHLWAASKHLAANNIVFVPGINEEIAATSVWGSQQVSLDADRLVDGVFGIWYAKGPGVDRSADPIKHANNAGAAKHGGVLLLAGDDHAAKSSTCPHQSDLNLRDMNVPVLAPSDIPELLEHGLLGVALSRYSGCWVALKITAELADSSASLDLARVRRRFPPPPPAAHPLPPV